MKIKNSILLSTMFIIIFSVQAYSETYLVNTDPEGTTIRMTSDYLRIAEEGAYDVKVPIKLINENGIQFIILNNPEKGFPWIKKGNNKLLAIYDDGYIILYDENSKSPVYEITSQKTIQDGESFIYSASSFLSSGKINYSAENLGKTILHNPYAEGVNDSGVGEKITISSKDIKLKITGFYLSNGFVSYEKPYLFEMNNRVKKISIDSVDGIHIGEYEITDTPLLQYIYLEKGYSKIVITITDVYKGTKYDDTCLNLILPTAWY